MLLLLEASDRQVLNISACPTSSNARAMFHARSKHQRWRTLSNICGAASDGRP